MKTWIVGISEEEITPKHSTYMAGFIARERPSEGVHDPLYARTLVISDEKEVLAVISLDLLGIDEELTEEIRIKAEEKLGFAGKNIIIHATHTHSGPCVQKNLLWGKIDFNYRVFLIERCIQSLEKALKTLNPAFLFFNIGKEDTIAFNRFDPLGPRDYDVPVLRIEDKDKNIKGILTSYACHPVVLGPQNLLFSADFPGFLIKTLKSIYGNIDIVYMTGCAGQINTGHSAFDSIKKLNMERRNFKEAERIGKVLAGVVLHTNEVMGDLRYKSEYYIEPTLLVETTLVDLPLLKQDSIEEIIKKKEMWQKRLKELESSKGDCGEKRLLEMYIYWAELMEKNKLTKDFVRVEVYVTKLGNIYMIFLPGEAFVEIGLNIKSFILSKGFKSMVVSYCNHIPGYIPYKSCYHFKNNYEVEESYRFYSLPAPFSPEASEILIDTVKNLVEKIESKKG
ncbi:MAG: neutral/alkaline non-lysosomal ceramidase N-terminal domain-containing protein [Sulfolobaceae archaeon]